MRPYALLGNEKDEIHCYVRPLDTVVRRWCTLQSRKDYDFGWLLIRHASYFEDTGRVWHDTAQRVVYPKNLILSGEFVFSVSDSVCGAAKITEGRFDVQTR